MKAGELGDRKLRLLGDYVVADRIVDPRALARVPVRGLSAPLAQRGGAPIRGVYVAYARYWAWADLMRRAFEIDVLACPRCGGRLRLIAIIEDPRVIEAILSRLTSAAQ